MSRIDPGEMLLIHGIEQDRSAVDEMYSGLSPSDRGEILLWLTRKKKGTPPVWVSNAITLLAALAFMDAGLRWAQARGVQ